MSSAEGDEVMTFEIEVAKQLDCWPPWRADALANRRTRKIPMHGIVPRHDQSSRIQCGFEVG